MKTYEQRIPRIYQPLSLSCTISMQGTQAKQSFKTDETGDAAFSPNRRLSRVTCVSTTTPVGMPNAVPSTKGVIE